MEKVDTLTKEKNLVEQQWRSTKLQMSELKNRFQTMRHEGNALKRHNSKLLINSFLSDMSDGPNQDAGSRVRLRQM